MSNTTIDSNDFTSSGFGPVFAQADDGSAESRPMRGWIPLVASAAALLALVVAGSVLFGAVVKSALGAL